MLEPIYSKLQQWVAETSPEVSWGLSLPTEEQPAQKAKTQVATYLFEVMRVPMARGERRSPLQLSLRFLVCAWAAKADEANELLVRLAFAAMATEGWDLEFESLPIQTWSAFHLSPRPSFMLCVPLLLERVDSPAKPVRSIRLEEAAMTNLPGQVLGPQDVPIAGAIVEAPALQRSTTTDHRGRFVLTGLPQSMPNRLVVKTKGKRIEVSPSGEPDPAKPFMIRLTSLED